MATVLRNNDPQIAPWVAAYNSLRAQLGVREFLHQKVADAAASTATTETTIWTAPCARTLTNVMIVPGAALTGDNTNNAVITLNRKNYDGSGSVQVAQFTTNVANGNWTAYVRKSVGALTNATFAAGQQLTLTITKGGTGVVVPSLELADECLHNDKSEMLVTAANASDLATSLTLLDNIRAVLAFHFADTLAHTTADATALAAMGARVTDGTLASAQTAANAHKSAWNTHILSTAVHPHADTLNTVSSANASDQSSLNTLLNEIKGDVNAALASGPPSPAMRLVDP